MNPVQACGVPEGSLIARRLAGRAGRVR
jgi:hypothetical protein